LVSISGGWDSEDFRIADGVSGFFGYVSFAAVWPKLTWRQSRFSDVHLEADILLVAALLQDEQIDEFPARD